MKLSLLFIFSILFTICYAQTWTTYEETYTDCFYPENMPDKGFSRTMHGQDFIEDANAKERMDWLWDDIEELEIIKIEGVAVFTLRFGPRNLEKKIVNIGDCYFLVEIFDCNQGDGTCELKINGLKTGDISESKNSAGYQLISENVLEIIDIDWFECPGSPCGGPDEAYIEVNIAVRGNTGFCRCGVYGEDDEEEEEVDSHHYSKDCYENNVYQYVDDTREELVETCGDDERCLKGNCVSEATIQQHIRYECYEGSVYEFAGSNDRLNLVEECEGNCIDDKCENLCEDKHEQVCVNNSVYWTDNCGNITSLEFDCDDTEICIDGDCTTYCGNGVCESSESCALCEDDCECEIPEVVEETDPLPTNKTEVTLKTEKPIENNTEIPNKIIEEPNVIVKSVKKVLNFLFGWLK